MIPLEDSQYAVCYYIYKASDSDYNGCHPYYCNVWFFMCVYAMILAIVSENKYITIKKEVKGRNVAVHKQQLRITKYVLVIMTQMISYMVKFNYSWYHAWKVFAVLTALFASYTDFRHDWAFYDKEKRLLAREKSYDIYFYYIVIVINPFLRFVWICSISDLHHSVWKK